MSVLCFQLTRSSRFLGGDITYTKVHIVLNVPLCLILLLKVEVPEAMVDILRSVQARKKRKQWIASMGGAMKKGARIVKGAVKRGASKLYETVKKRDSSTAFGTE